MNFLQAKGTLRKNKGQYRHPVPEILPITINRKMPVKLVPGCHEWILYWKIAIYLEIPNLRVELFVPPEWRSISRHRLEEWVGRLRDDPYEDITLGGAKYHWTPQALIPYAQKFNLAPIPGMNGLPIVPEEIPYFDSPRVIFSNGQNLPIRTNRILPPYIMPGMEYIYCYWKISLPGVWGRPVYVPPEWRVLTPKALRQWCILLAENEEKDITLGGVRYKWNGNDIIPIDQRIALQETIGFGEFTYASNNEEELLYMENKINFICKRETEKAPIYFCKPEIPKTKKIIKSKKLKADQEEISAENPKPEDEWDAAIASFYEELKINETMQLDGEVNKLYSLGKLKGIWGHEEVKPVREQKNVGIQTQPFNYSSDV